LVKFLKIKLMKKLYISILLTAFFSITTHAQLTLTKAVHDAVIGDITYMAKYDSTTAIPKLTGAGQSWNFNSFTMGTFTETATYMSVGSTPQGTSFPLATIAVLRGSSNYDYFKQSVGVLEFAGNSSAPTDKVVFSNLATWNNWPVAFGNSNTDSFTALETTPTQTNNWNGTLSYTASGTGTVTLPGGNVHTNCLQLKKSITLVITGTSTGTMNMMQYHYYSSSTKYPIVTVEYQSITSGTTTSKQVDIYVNTAALSVGVNEKESAASNFIIYPNPASTDINVFLPNNTTATSIQVIDVTGKVVASINNSNSINVSALAKGIYYVKVKSMDAILQKPLVIAE
jgi:hypothetical protein